MKDIFSRLVEEEIAAAKDTVNKRFPKLMYESFLWVDDPSRRLAIDDVSYRVSDPLVQTEIQKHIAVIKIVTNNGLVVYSLIDLTKKLTDIMKPTIDIIDRNKTLIIYPGEGAQTVRSIAQIPSDFPTLVIPARRIKDPETGKTIGTDLPTITDTISTDEIETVLVIDDVIDTGNTLISLKEKLGLHQSRWLGATPMMFSPVIYSDRPPNGSSIDQYDEVFAGVLIQGRKNPIQLNSLSSFIESGEKRDRLISECRNAFFPKSQDHYDRFTNATVQIRNLLAHVT